MSPLVDWVWHCEGDVAEVIRGMEMSGLVRPGTFKPLERLQVPADYVELVRRLQNPDFKCTATRMRTLLKEILAKRSWQWLLQHPDLGTEWIHPSRSMCLPCSVDCFGCGLIPCGWQAGTCVDAQGVHWFCLETSKPLLFLSPQSQQWRCRGCRPCWRMRKTSGCPCPTCTGAGRRPTPSHRWRQCWRRHSGAGTSMQRCGSS